MADGYTKLFSSITDSTIWAAPDATRLVWITLLAMADQNGYVGASVPGLAARARVSLEACIEALDTFLAPDQWSRTPDFEGRRITVANGGWLLLNHAKYRAAIDKEARKEQSRLLMQKLRDGRKTVSKVSNVNTGEPPFAQAEAEAEAEEKKSTTMSPPATPKADPVPYAEIINLYHQKLPTNPKVVMLTTKRKATIGSRWRSGTMPDLATWGDYFERVSESDFLTGKVEPNGDRKRFIADIDWLINESNIIKVAEGKYHGKG